jgi:hypothetical protein
MSQADKTVRRELVTSPDTLRTGYLKLTSISPLLGAPINTVAADPVKNAGFEGWMATALLKVTPQCANWCSTTSKHFNSSKATRQQKTFCRLNPCFDRLYQILQTRQIEDFSHQP